MLPGAPLVRSGPYRWFSHPNYVAVIIEGFALPLTGSAWITACAFTVLNAALLTVRIRCETAALAAAAPAGPARRERAGGLGNHGMIDVLVVGGGPVGLATAIRCALAGLSVTVAEPRGAPIDKACGEGVMPAAVRRLAALGVRPDGHPLRGIRYVDERHQADARFTRGDGLGVRRTVLHAALAERAAALGIPVLPARVTAFEQHASHVTAAESRPATWWRRTGCTRRSGAAWKAAPARGRAGGPRLATGCAGTTGSRRGRTWSRCT